ncbi:MAG: hypothetical protein IJ357_08405 [Oscillospiraceae bacterium]|nr:hypothetical protein [Oscillospiraceae bacterium]
MKQRCLVLICLLTCLLALSGCQDSKIPEGYRKVGSFTEIDRQNDFLDSFEDLLPDFEIEMRSGSSITYTNVTPRALKKYVNTLCSKEGFSCEESLLEYLLYRDDLVLFITNNTENYGECTISGYAQQQAVGSGTVTAQDAMSLAGEHAFTLMELSDQEIYEQTGIQRFIAPVDTQDQWPEIYGDDKFNQGYAPILYYVGPKGALYLENSAGCDAIYADLNQNAVPELVTWGIGPSGGRFSYYIYGIELVNEVPTIVYSSDLRYGSYGAYHFEKDAEGQLWLVVEPNGYNEDLPDEWYLITLDGDKAQLTLASDAISQD